MILDVPMRARAAQRRMLWLLCGLILCATGSSGSQAAPISFCEYKFLSEGDKGLSGEAKVQISRGMLKMFAKSFPYWRNGVLITHGETSYRILQQNEVGIVAVSTRSYRDKDIGPIVGATVLTIRKSDGAMREAGVEVKGVRDLMVGHCK